MPNQEKARDNSLWIEITDQKGFLMFGDLALYQKKEREINISSGEVDIICENCPHKYRDLVNKRLKEKEKFETNDIGRSF